MSMYTQLLDAALEQRDPTRVRPTTRSALHALRRCRRELGENPPAGEDPDAVPRALAREIGYDVALLELAETLGIANDASRFEHPRDERSRLEQALRDRGLRLHPAGDQNAPRHLAREDA